MSSSGSNCTVREWEGREAFARELVSEAAGLFDGSGQADPLCNEPTWLIEHAEAFLSPDEVFGWTLSDSEGPLAFLAFRREPSRGPLALRRALLSSDGTFDSEYLDVAVRPGHEPEVAGRMIDLLRQRGGIEALVLTGVPNDSAMLAALRVELGRRGLPLRERAVDCLSAKLPPTFDEYLKGLRSRMRSKVRQALRKADAAGATFAWCTEDIEQHLAGLFDLHTRRWEQEGQPGSFASAERRQFFGALARAHAERGSLRLSRLDRSGEPIAYQFGVCLSGRYYQIQEGYDPGIEEFRGATALRAHSLRALIEEGVREYDFMAGNSRHKKDWGGELRPCTTLAFALPRWRARLTYGLRAWQDRRARRAAEAQPSIEK